MSRTETNRFVVNANDLIFPSDVKGGIGSGNFGHSGRPGLVGGSSPGGGIGKVLASQVRRQGGFTYNPLENSSPKSGYVVALPREQGYERVYSLNTFKGSRAKEILKGFLRDVRDGIKRGEFSPNAHAGAWLDRKTNRVVLDVSEVYKNARQAIKLGKERFQDAIYQIGVGELDLREAKSRNAGFSFWRGNRGRVGSIGRSDDGEIGSVKGGVGSGHFGHEGRPGLVGGSADSSSVRLLNRGFDAGDIFVYDKTGETSFRSSHVASQFLHQVSGAFDVDVPEHPNALRAAFTVAETLREMRAKGYEMPDSVEVKLVSGTTDLLAGRTTWTRPRLSYAPFTTTLSISVPDQLPPEFSLDKAAEIGFGGKTKNMARYDNIDRFSIRTFKDIVVHEMAHVQNGPRLYKPMPGPELWPHAATTVSNYATDNTNEFLAEAFVKMYRGDTLSYDARKLYDELGGVQKKALQEVIMCSLNWPNLTTEEWRQRASEIKGGAGSGNFGHSGRPGLVGGSSSDSMVGGTLYHGTSSPNFALQDGLLYLARAKAEADIFGGNRTFAIDAKPGRSKNIADVVDEAVAEGDDVEEVIRQQASQARAEGYRYLEFTHPSGGDGEDFVATVSLYPKDDLLIIDKKGGEGSGHHGHAGRLGEVGGSAPSGSSGVSIVRQFATDEEGYGWHEKGKVREWALGLSKEDRSVIDTYAGFGYSDINNTLRGNPPTKTMTRDATPEEDELLKANEYKPIDLGDGKMLRVKWPPSYKGVAGEIVWQGIDQERVDTVTEYAKQINDIIANRGIVLDEDIEVSRVAYLPSVTVEQLEEAADGSGKHEEKGFSSTFVGPAGGRATGEGYLAYGIGESKYKRYGSNDMYHEEAGTAVKFEIVLPAGTKVISVEAARRSRNYRGTTDLDDPKQRVESEVLIGSGARFRIDRITKNKPINNNWTGNKDIPYITIQMMYIGGGSSAP